MRPLIGQGTGGGEKPAVGWFVQRLVVCVENDDGDGGGDDGNDEELLRPNDDHMCRSTLIAFAIDFAFFNTKNSLLLFLSNLSTVFQPLHC